MSMVKDVVCGMTVDDRSARFKTGAGGKEYYCSAGRLASFTASPARYVR
jgi:YHS domain-containing protein